MDSLKVKTFIIVCTIVGDFGYLNLGKQELIEFYKECLIMARHFDDSFAIMISSWLVGDLLLEMNCFIDAVTYFEKALLLSVKMGIKEIEGKVLASLGMASLNKCDEAIKYFQRSLKIAIEIPNEHLESKNYTLMGVAYQTLGKSFEAIKYFVLSLQILKETDENILTKETYLALGYSYESLEDYEEAINVYEKSLNIAKKLNDTHGEKIIYLKLAEVYEAVCRYQDAITCCEKGLKIAKELGDKIGERSSYEKLGKVYSSLNKYQEAIKCYEKSLSIAQEIDDTKWEGKHYLHIGNIYVETGRYYKAIECYKKCRKIAEEIGDMQTKGYVYINLANVYQQIGDHQEALKLHKLGLKTAKETRDKTMERTIYANIGQVYHEMGEYQEAIKYNTKCLNRSIESRDKKAEGVAYGNLGINYRSLGNHKKSISYHERSLIIAREIMNKRGEGIAYMNLGNVHSSKSENKKAIEYYKRGLNIAKEIGDKMGEALSYVNLGAIYIELGKYYEAIKYKEKGLCISIEVGNKKLEGRINIGLANVHILLGRCEESITYFEKGLNISKEIGDKVGEIQMLNFCGKIHFLSKNFHEAINYFRESLNIAIEIGAKESTGDSYENLGNVFVALGKYYEAIAYFELGQSIAIEIGNKRAEGTIYMHFGRTYYYLENFKDALKNYEKSLNIFISIGNKHFEGVVNYNLGQMYYHLGMINTNDKQMSQEYMQKSICFLHDSLHSTYWLFSHLQERDDFKISIVDTFIKTYNLLTTVLIESQQIQEALLVCDRGRACALGDLLASKYGVNKDKVSRSRQMQYADIESILSSCTVCIVEFAILPNKGLCIWVATHQKPLCFIQCENQDTDYTGLVLQLEKCQERNYYGLHLAKVIKDAFHKMEITRAARCENRLIETHAIYSNIHDVYKDTKEESSSFLSGNHKPKEENTYCSNEQHPFEILFSLLVAPVLQNLEQEEIVIIPDGPLFMVPFAALRDPNTGLFLSETKRIRLVPSLTTLKTLQECPSDYHSKKGALIVGDPEVGEVMFQGEKTIFPPLPSANLEAVVVGANLNVKPLIGSQANKEIFKKKLREGVAIIHIAAHGCSENGYIALGPSSQEEETIIPEEEDYMLTMQEVQEIGVRAQLVVLSCCHRGRGEIKSEGVVGMSRAFLAAGARAVVASLWAIDDDATLNFMVTFYMYLKMGHSASRSLQLAMKEMREDGYVKERHWAPFFLIGEDVTISV